MNANLYLQFLAPFTDTANKTLIETADGRCYSYGEALNISRRLARVLDDMQVRPGDRVAVQVNKSPEAIMLYLACLQRGAVYLPLNPAYTDNEIGYFLGDAEPILYVCRPEALAQARRLAKRFGVAAVESLGEQADGSLMEQAERAAPQDEVVDLPADALASILYTSGTTGRSKGAMLSHGNLAANSQALMEAWRFRADDRLLHALPIFHIHGLFVACNLVLKAGASMMFLPRMNPEQLLDLMPKATVLMGVPTFYTRLLRSPRLNRETTATMRLFISGSAPLLAETHAEFLARTGHAIIERYGMTETNMNTSNPYDGERRPGTVGLPLPGTELRITDKDSGAELPSGEIGLVEVRGPNVFQGYWRMPEKTRAEFRDDGFFITGDLGRIDQSGYLHIVGRDKDLIISGGYNVYPKEVEQLIDDLPGVEESAVFGVPHPDFGEGVTAVVVAAKQAAAPEEAVVLAALADSLARYKQPKRIFVMESLPRNVMGKVQKNLLRERYADIYRQEASLTD